METSNEIIVYRPDSTLRLDVRLEGETVWLSRSQIALLFDRDVKTIGKHINNALHEELEGLPTVAKFAIVQVEGNRTVTRLIEHYSLDVIISVGYRVKSKRGVQFRTWANTVLKEYLLRGYSVNNRLLEMERTVNYRFTEQGKRLDELSEKVDFFLKTSLPPNEGIFFDRQIFDAYALICDLVRGARRRIVLVDNYADDTVLKQLDKRGDNVKAIIYSPTINRGLKQDVLRHNAQYRPIVLKTCHKAHDRFLIIDDTIYHIGASLKDLGKKLFAFSKMEIIQADKLIEYLEL